MLPKRAILAAAAVSVAAFFPAASSALADTTLNIVPHGEVAPGVPWASTPGILPADTQAKMYDRITPLFRNLPDIPRVAVHFTLGSFLAICGGWMCNIFFKISMHALAAGGLCAFFIIFSMHDPFASGLYISVCVLIAGLVCTARLILAQHTPFEIVTGLIVGVLAQAVAWLF